MYVYMNICEVILVENFCGANCLECSFKGECKGCKNTGGKPFGGSCIAAEYIKAGGKDKYNEFKNMLINEINALDIEGMPKIDTLHELSGAYVNLEYPLPSGKSAKFLSDNKVYLGCQAEIDGCDICYGVVCDTSFILVCQYGCDGANPEIVLYKRR